MSAFKVLIADDHVIVREGLVALLDMAEGIKIVGEATNGREAIEMTKRLRPDVVLMDIRMAKLDVTYTPRRLTPPGAAAGRPGC